VLINEFRKRLFEFFFLDEIDQRLQHPAERLALAPYIFCFLESN
jgi:hypothetical protein